MVATEQIGQARGTSLVETLVAIVVLAISLAIGTSLFSFSTRTFSRETLDIRAQTNLAGARNLVLDDLSIAGYRPAELPGPLTVLSDTFQAVSLGTNLDSVEFVGDVDSDGDTDRICYDVVSGSLRRTELEDATAACSSGTSETITTGVTQFNLTFLGSSRTARTEAEVLAGGSAGAYSVQIAVTAQVQAKGGMITKTFQGETAIRNGLPL